MRQNGPDHERLKAWASVLCVLVIIAGVSFKLRDAVAPHDFGSGGGNRDPNALPPDVALRLNQTVFTGHDAIGRKSWSVRADRVDASIDKTRIEFNGHIDALLFDSATGKTRAHVTAPYAVFTLRTKTLQVGSKLVCAVPGNGDANDMRMETDTLLWNAGSKQILCPGKVHVDLAAGRGTSDGWSLTLDLTTREWSMQRFHGAFYLQDGEGTAAPPFANPIGKLPL